MCHNTSDFALRDQAGNDVSPVARWRSTMLANSSKDPFWKAKVKHEGIENPAHKEALENVCTRCHAPMGMVNALLAGEEEYTLEHLHDDPMGKDGISCTLCHQINDFSSPSFSGNFGINASKEIYGPYENPITHQMQMNSGYTPVYDEKINESRLCGSCHTLVTHSVDDDGNFTGEDFVEQAIYQEWENSSYGNQNVSCETCHMPRIDDAVKISSRPGYVTARQPFGIHDFTGGNVFMLTLLKENHDELELNSGTALFDETIQRTRRLLTEGTIDLNIETIEHRNDSMFVNVSLKNMAGHKFPTGFPSRRAYLEFMVTEGEDTLFHSGKKGASPLVDFDEDRFEPHHQVIYDDSDIQIYEFVMGNTENEVTTVLERAYEPLKDNRIVPEGFQQNHSNYDTVKVVGEAVGDADYFSGEGSESIIYAFAYAPKAASLSVKVALHYETVPESWVQELFEHSEADEDIRRFETMYLKAERTSVLVAADSTQITATLVPAIKKNEFRIYPNPTSGRITVEGVDKSLGYTVFSAAGRWVKEGFIEGSNPEISLDLPPGSYIFVLHGSGGLQTRQLIIR